MHITLWLDRPRPWPDLVERACQAEAAGWDALRFGDPVQEGARSPECWAVVGALAGEVPRMRLEAVVRDQTGRHPAVVAKLASTADQLSGGRLLLGFGPPAGPDAELRLSEAVAVVRSLTANDRTTFSGTFYQLRDAPLDPKPIQIPFPILLVGASPALAATQADHWSITGAPPVIDSQLRALDESCRTIGRAREAITVSVVSDAPPQHAGVHEWVVPESALGEDPSAWPEALADMRSVAAGAQAPHF